MHENHLRKQPFGVDGVFSPVAFFLLPLILLDGAMLFAADQPQWGERHTRNMTSAEKDLPTRFQPGKRNAKTDDIDLPDETGVRWVARLGNRTYSTPIVAGGKVYIGTNNDRPRDQRYTEDRGVLMCFDEQTGRFLWQLSLPKLTHLTWADVGGVGITGTPVVEGNRVYLVTNRDEVMCLDVEGMANGNDGPFLDEAKIMAEEGREPQEPIDTDADIIWCYDLVGRLDVRPHDACASTPLLNGNLLYVTTSNGLEWTHDAVPKPKSPNLVVFDKRTGRPIARDAFGIGEDIVHGQWCAASFGMIGGKPQVFWGGGNGVIYGIEPPRIGSVAIASANDELAPLRCIWRLHGDPQAQTLDVVPVVHQVGSPNYKITCNPVFYKNRIYLPVTQEPFHRTEKGWLLCVDATKTGDITRTGILWSCDTIGPTASTVAITDGLVFAVSFEGRVFCLDAETGEQYGTYDVGKEVWGSPLLADGKLYVGNTRGTLAILTAAKDLQPLATIKMPDGIHSTPTAANGTLFIPTKRYLFAVVESK